jgi:hypothetical protein
MNNFQIRILKNEALILIKKLAKFVDLKILLIQMNWIYF